MVDNSQAHKQPKLVNIMNEVTIGTPVKIDIKPVNVADQPVQKTIGTAGYGYTNLSISKSETLIHNPGSRHMGVWHPNRSISSENADETMKSMTTVIDGEIYQGRPATIEELASYESIFYEELENTILVALGEKVLGDSRGYVACRRVGDSERELNLDRWTHDWYSYYRFLVVFEKVSVPE